MVGLLSNARGQLFLLSIVVIDGEGVDAIELSLAVVLEEYDFLLSEEGEGVIEYVMVGR